jgi:hypothetical protein
LDVENVPTSNDAQEVRERPAEIASRDPWAALSPRIAQPIHAAADGQLV